MKILPTLLLLTALPIHPLSAGGRQSRAAAQSKAAPSAGEEIPAVAFCRMAEYPRDYFDKTVRLTATYEMGTEGARLADEQCARGHDEQIGVGFFDAGERQRELNRGGVNKIATTEYGARARVTVVGILRDSSRRDFQWYRYRFDIIRFEEISHVIVPYEGALQAGITYRAAVRGDARFGLYPVTPLRTQEHIAARIEWTNLGEFPALKRLRHSPRERQIVFSVISDQSRQMTERRWDRTIGCKIIRVE